MSFKRFISVLISITIFALPLQYPLTVEAKRVLSTHQLLASGSVTLADMKISAVNGVAFVDFGVADVLTGKLGCLLKIKDSLGNAIQGIIKAAGTGAEGLGIELVDGWTNSTAYPYDTLTTVGSDVTSAISLGPNRGAKKVVTAEIGKLYKIAHTVTPVSGGLPVFGWWTGDGFNVPSVNVGTDSPAYFTAVAAYTILGFFNSNVASWGMTGYSAKQVLTPSSTGVTIVNSKGGTIYNWTNKSSLFDYASTTFTYEIFRLPPVVVATADVTQANFHADLTDTNAFVDLIGVDLTAYQTGKYLLGIYNKTDGYGMLGHISSVAPAGETLTGTELILNPAFTTDTSNWTAKNSASLSSVAGGEADNCLQILENGATNPYAQQVIGMTEKRLNKFSLYVKAGTEATYNAWMREQVGNKYHFITAGAGAEATGSWVQHSVYFTVIDTGNTEVIIGQYCSLGAGTTLFYDTLSCQRVLDPSSTGARIVSIKGGATRAWFYKHASFNPNDTAGQTYKIYYLGD